MKKNNDNVFVRDKEIVDPNHCSRCGDEIDPTSHEISNVTWHSWVKLINGKTFIFTYQKNLCAKCTEDLKDWASLEANDE